MSQDIQEIRVLGWHKKSNTLALFRIPSYQQPTVFSIMFSSLSSSLESMLSSVSQWESSRICRCWEANLEISAGVVSIFLTVVSVSGWKGRKDFTYDRSWRDGVLFCPHDCLLLKDEYGGMSFVVGLSWSLWPSLELDQAPFSGILWPHSSVCNSNGWLLQLDLQFSSWIALPEQLLSSLSVLLL